MRARSATDAGTSAMWLAREDEEESGTRIESRSHKRLCANTENSTICLTNRVSPATLPTVLLSKVVSYLRVRTFLALAAVSHACLSACLRSSASLVCVRVGMRRRSSMTAATVACSAPVVLGHKESLLWRMRPRRLIVHAWHKCPFWTQLYATTAGEVRELDLRSIPMLSPYAPSMLGFSGLPHLTTMRVAWLDAGMAACLPARLTELHVVQSNGVLKMADYRALARLPLAKLSLVRMPLMSEHVSCLARALGPTLRVLRVGALHLMSRGDLKRLSAHTPCVECGCVPSIDFHQTLSLPKKLQQSRQTCWHGADALDAFAQLVHLRSLRCRSLARASSAAAYGAEDDVQAIFACLSQMPSLRTLHIEADELKTPARVAALALCFPRLRSLALSKCYTTHDSLQQILAHVGELASQVPWIENGSSSSSSSINGGLQTLRIVGDDLRTTNFSALAPLTCLQTLSLARSHVSRTFGSTVPALPALTHLDLTRCKVPLECVTHAAFPRLASLALPLLPLSACDTIRNVASALQAFATTLHTLECNQAGACVHQSEWETAILHDTVLHVFGVLTAATSTFMPLALEGVALASTADAQEKSSARAFRSSFSFSSAPSSSSAAASQLTDSPASSTGSSNSSSLSLLPRLRTFRYVPAGCEAVLRAALPAWRMSPRRRVFQGPCLKS